MMGRRPRPEPPRTPEPAPVPHVRTVADVDLDLAEAHREVLAAADALNLARLADANEAFEALLDERYALGQAGGVR